MIEGGWPYIWAAYAVAIGALAALAIVVIARAMHWAQMAKREKP
jgi:hypothetical protein